MVSLIPPEIVIHPYWVPQPQQPQLDHELVGRLITPKEGCGTPGARGKVNRGGQNRVVGGNVARNGR